jgi:hypothetical protein
VELWTDGGRKHVTAAEHIINNFIIVSLYVSDIVPITLAPVRPYEQGGVFS